MALADELRATLHKTGKEWVYWPLIDRAEKAVRIAASQPDRKPVEVKQVHKLRHLLNYMPDKDFRLPREEARELLRYIDALSLLSVQVDGEQKKPPIKCDNCGKMYSDHAPEGGVVCECAAQAVRAMKEATMGRPASTSAATVGESGDCEAYMADTGTAGIGDGCNKPFWLEHDAIEYVRLHGGHVAPLYLGPPAPAVGPDVREAFGQIIDSAMEWRPGPNNQSYIEARADFQAMLNAALLNNSSDPTLSAEGIREALEQLVSACEQVFCSDATEKPTAELEPCSDDDAVMAGEDGDDRRLTFGMIRRARAALSALPATSGTAASGTELGGEG